MEILKEIKTRRQYKTRWQAIARAKAKGLNVALLDRLYAEIKKRGYSHEFALDGVLYAARCGAFGFVNGCER